MTQEELLDQRISYLVEHGGLAPESRAARVAAWASVAGLLMQLLIVIKLYHPFGW